MLTLATNTDYSSVAPSTKFFGYPITIQLANVLHRTMLDEAEYSDEEDEFDDEEDEGTPGHLKSASRS
jgi:hypothetical protein